MPIPIVSTSKQVRRLRSLFVAALLVCVGAALVYDNLDTTGGQVCEPSLRKPIH